MKYEVTIDFGDNAVQAPHICSSLSDLGLYLERVPSMFGFQSTLKADVKIKTIERATRLRGRTALNISQESRNST